MGEQNRFFQKIGNDVRIQHEFPVSTYINLP
jgi:hypothetical protein